MVDAAVAFGLFMLLIIGLTLGELADRRREREWIRERAPGHIPYDWERDGI